jgi:undecaprenyl-diphosphatase
MQDERLLAALALREAPRWLDWILRVSTHAGSAVVTIGASLALLAASPTRRLGLMTGMANLLSHLVVQGLKRTVIRRRPAVRQPYIPALASSPDHYSFPSGHACAAMAVALPVLLDTPTAGLPLLGIALTVGASRVYLRVHYVTDVVVGQILGAVTALLVALSLS